MADKQNMAQSLPAAPEPTIEVHDCNRNVAPKPHVLVVDDSITVRMDLAEIFETAGFEVTACECLADARGALSAQQFSLVILDILLPDGDGIDLLRDIKGGSATRNIAVMLLSTEAEIRDRLRGLKTGADEYVGKPYDAVYVLARARELIDDPLRRPDERPLVLHIDDSLTFCEEFKCLLTDAGYTVAATQTGEEGLRAAYSLRPDLIIVDRILSGAMDGVAVVRRLKEDLTLRNTPCLLLTASVESGGELDFLEAGADAYAHKQSDVRILLARIAALLRSSAAPAPAGTRAGLAAKKILTVDDSVTYLYELGSELRQDGYDVIPAASGKEALELLEAQPVDCILLDLRMPDLSGDETCRIIKNTPRLRNIPLVMLTAVEDSQAIIQGINAGADDYIPKSVEFQVLKARVRAQLRRKQSEDEYRHIREELLQMEIKASQARLAQQVAETRAALVDELEQKNRELNAFASAVSHDLRAPLRTIHGFSQVLLDDYSEQLPEQARDYLKRVQGAARRMSSLIDSLLQLSRMNRATLTCQMVDLSALTRAVGAELQQANPGRNVEFSVQEGLTVHADRELLTLLLRNLLDNAWKFTSKREAAKIEVGALRQNQDVVFFVRDNGAGFDSSRADRLFQPFERLHPERDFPGVGIGLATVYRIVARHGGRIWAESRPLQGATFFFTLPQTQNGAAA